MEKRKSKPKNSAALSEDDLMWAIGFTPVELTANRDGVLSDYQRRKFRAARRENFLTIVPCVLVATAVLVVGQIWISPVNSICLLIPVILCMVIGAFVLVEALAYHSDIRQDRVDSVQGHISLDISDKGKNSTYLIQIQHKVWPVKKDVFLAFKNGDPYVIYYSPHSNKILSAEWLRDD